jgi:type IV secretion system protein TrbI
MTVMKPEESPKVLRESWGVRRVNNVPLYIVGGTAFFVLLIIFLVMLNRASSSSESIEEEQKPSSSKLIAEEIINSHPKGVIPAAIPSKIKDKLNQNSGSFKDINQDELPNLTKDSEEDAKIAEIKWQQFQDAINSESAITVGLKEGDSLENSSPVQDKSSKDKSGYGQFLGGEGEDRFRLDSKLEKPRSPFELRAGFVIPALLISGVNSDIEGQAVGQVAQNVFDTATGDHLLIPKGARLVGSYLNNIDYGQSRVLMAWQRIVFPDGRALDLGAMPGGDSAGYSGFSDKVDNHYARLFGSAVLLSGITAGVALSQNNNNSGFGNISAAQTLSQSLGVQLGQTTTQLLEKNIDIAPTLEIRPGYRFNVIVTKDLTFNSAYKDFSNE